MAKTHLLAGPNNAGKSNVLQVAKNVLPALRDGTPYLRGDLDLPIVDPSDRDSPFRLAIRKQVSGEQLHELVDNHPGFSPEVLLNLFSGPTFAPAPGGRVLFSFENEDEGSSWRPSAEQVNDFTEAGDRHGQVLGELSSYLTSSRGGGEDAQRVLNSLTEKLQVKQEIPEVASIGAFRQIRPGDDGDVIDDEHDGPGLIERLARLQNPDYDGDRQRERFERINRFLKVLLEDDEARIEIPHKAESINVYHEGRRLPLESYGTGLHEVIILAAAATVLSEHLVCIEEPEVHLHPTLQRRLLRYLNTQTDNQYLIATHSAHMLDFASSSISAVRLTDGRSELSRAIEPREVAAISFDLGARASDLVQANSVIWVEGPSDAIYLQAWITALDPDLIEGIHYSLLHYGGRLLNHLSADEDAVDEFVRLPQINRHFAVVMDSDREGSHQHLGETKQRVRREIDAVDGAHAWITKGYTIENYVPTDLLREAVGAIHPNAALHWSGDRFQNPLAKEKIRGTPKEVDKIAIAKYAAARMTDASDWLLDLKTQVQSLVNLVHEAND